MFRSRRRPRYGPPVIAAVVVLLLLLLLLLVSVSLLYSRLNNSDQSDLDLNHNPLLGDTTDVDYHSSDDPIDLTDNDPVPDSSADADDADDDDEDEDEPKAASSSSSYYYDHSSGVVRRGYNKRSIEEWEDYVPFDAKLRLELGFDDQRGNVPFGSDDVPVEERVRNSLVEASYIEDSLLLKGSSLREAWGDWFDKKTDFLRRDKMFKSNLEALNPINNAMLQDPDSPGVTAFTRADKIILKATIDHFKIDNKSSRLHNRKTLDHNNKLNNDAAAELHADGQRWGYFPGVDDKLSFGQFMDLFLSKANCSMRVFMVWNSPSWAFGVRHQRGLESLLFHHPDACVLVFSETIELNFFNDFVQQGYKVAVVMPNLDELLKDTPTHIFGSVWYEWKQTKYYPAHYSELIRLAVLYKYGGIYLDFDIIVLKPISSLLNTVGMEDEKAGSTLNGAIMAFDKHSLFIMECLKEFYASYDDTNLRWNGADLLSRVAGNLSSSRNHANKVSELTLLPSFVSFPINRKEISRYFVAPKTEMEKSEQDNFFEKIPREYATFHFWNSITAALIPEHNSLVARILNNHCIHCSDVT